MGIQATRLRRRCWSRNVLEPSWVSFDHRQNCPARQETHNPEYTWTVCSQFPECVGADEGEDLVGIQ